MEFEQNFKSGYKHEDAILSDEQLVDLFSEMKRENQAKK
jgi:hypothetical protein